MVLRDEIEEWSIKFALKRSGEGDVAYERAETLLLRVLTPWVEENDLAVGGGFEPYPAPDFAKEWVFKLGICSQPSKTNFVKRELMEEMFQTIRNWAKDNGLYIDGSFGPFNS